MRTPIFSLLALLGLSTTAAFAENSEASDQFLSAYLAFQKAEKAEAAGDTRGAQRFYNQAINSLDGIRARWPSWNPAIVALRREKAAEAVTRLSGGAPSRAIGSVIPETVEPPLPEGGNPLPPDTFPAAPAPPRSTGKRTTSSGDPIAEIQSKLQTLESDLQAAREKLAKAEREKAALAKQMAEAEQQAKKTEDQMVKVQKRADLAEKALADAERSGNKNDAELNALRTEVAATKKALRQLQIERDAEAELGEQFRGILNQSRARAQQLAAERDSAQKASADVPKRIAEMQQQIDQVNKEKAALEAELGKVREQLALVTTERDTARTELTKLREASKNVDKLLTENSQLLAKLQETEKTVATLKLEGAEKDKKIAELTKEVTTARAQLAEAQKVSADFQAQMDEMRKSLEAQGKELTQARADVAAGVADRKKLAEENDLLRGIVLRQQKEQANRDRVRKLVLEQMAKLENVSGALKQQIDLLGSPVVKLTDREKKLFKEPQLSISDTEIAFGDGPTPPPATPEPTPATPPTPPPTEPLKIAQENPAPAILPDAPLPDALPDITGGNKTAKTDPPKTSIEGDLPKKDDAPAALPGPGVKTGLQPAVPPDLVGLSRDAKDQFERGNYREAEKIYLKALAKAPNNLYVLSNLAVTQFRQQKYKLAEETFKKAIAIAPEDDFSHTTLGIVYYQQQKFDDAIQSLTRALAINPKNATAHNYLGITASQKGWQEAALKELLTAVNIDPNYADAHFNLSVVYATATPANKEEARKHYKRATELGAEPDAALEQMLK
jgi:tetratricopeptide (TPR) repeat protein